MIYAFNLPEEIVRLIYAFCIDKREHWDKVTEQFFKGGFNRKNLRIIPFIREQKKMCKYSWLADRPELEGFTQWNPVSRKIEQCPFDYRFGEWSIKTKSVMVCFNTITGDVHKTSSKKPVSRWLKNVDKFEVAHGQPLYLPKEKNNFGIKFESAFYKKRAHMREKKIKKKAHLKKANLFIEERRQLKKMCGFELKQHIVLSFHMPVPILGSTQKFYSGSIVQIFLRPHRDNGRLIFSKPKGKYEFDNDAVDNYIGQTLIAVKFEDGEIRSYTPEKLAARINQTNTLLKGDLALVRGWYTAEGCQYCGSFEKITIKGVQRYINKEAALTSWTRLLIFDKKFRVVGEIQKQGEVLITLD